MPPSCSNFFHFDAAFRKKILPNNRFTPQTQGLAPPHLGNPGTAIVNYYVRIDIYLMWLVAIDIYRDAVKKGYFVLLLLGM